MNRLSRLNSIFLWFNGGKNSGNHAPGQGRGIGKPGSGRGGFSHNTTFSDKDDVEYTFSDGTKVKGELFYSLIDDFWSIRYQRPGDKITYSVRLDSSDKWDKVKKIKSASKKEEEKILEELKEQGITHKSPKERQTKRQKEIIRSLDKMGVLSSDMNKWLSNYGDENVLGEIENELSKAKELGLKLNDIALEKKTTGTKVLGSAGISKDGYNIKFTGQVLDGNPVKIKKMTNDSKKFHTSDTVKGLVRHEIGHIISYYIANGGLSPHGADRHGLEDIDANAGAYCQALIKKVIGKENMSPRQVSQYIENASTKDISRYGKTDAYEFVAEAYSNPDYSEATRKLTNELTQDLKNLKQGKPVIFNKRKDENNSDEIEICSGYGPEEITISIPNGHLEKLNRLEIQLNGGKNSGNHNPGQGRGIGKPGGDSYLSSQAKNLTWGEYQSQMRDEKFRKVAVDAGLKSYDDLWQVWANTKNKDFTSSDIKELSKEQTIETIRKNLNDLNPDMWFVNADSNYKPRIVNRILERKELRNAGLNLAYQNYKNLNDNPLSFSDFLNTEMKMYRGHRGQKTIESDWFDSYTPKREFAEQFGSKIKTISIKPKDTLGSYTTNAESEYLILTKLKQENSIQFNGGPGSGNHNPGQGRGVGKPNGGSGGRNSKSGKGSSKSSGDSTVFRVGDDITFTKDGKTYEGSLQYKDGHWYLLRDKSEGGLMEITVDDVRRSKRGKTAAQKEKERKLEQLGEQGIRHKTPKERQTPRQREIIHSLDNMGVLSPDMQKWLLNYGDEEVLGHIEYELSRAEAFGLKLSRVNLERLRTGSSTWGKAFYSGKFAFVGQMLDGNPMKIQQIEKDSNKFHAEDSVKAVVKHEIGHLISYQIGRQFTTGSFSDEFKTNTYCNHLVRDVARKDFWDLTENEISRYGMKNVRECIAESWSNPDYSEFTKKIATQMEKDLDDTRDLQTFNMLSRQQEEDEDELCSGYGPEFEEDMTIEVETEDRKERLNYLKLQLNGGKNSGNHNPGQGRGVGKPGGSSSYTKAEKEAVQYWKEGNDGWGYSAIRAILHGKTPVIVQKQLDLQNTEKAKYLEEELTKIAKDFKSAVNKAPQAKGNLVRVTGTYTQPKKGDLVEFDTYMSFSKNLPEQTIKDLASAGTTIYHLPAKEGHKDISNIGKSFADAENEVVNDRKLSYLVEKVSTEKVGGREYQRVDLTDKIQNGGKNSGNYNPGQGRGVGKPGGHASLKTLTATKTFEDNVRKTSRYMSSPERFYAIAESLNYTGTPKMVSSEEFETLKNSEDYIPMFRGFRSDMGLGITAVEAVEDFVYGDYYAGSGRSRFGDGIYLATEEGYATSYSSSVDPDDFDSAPAVLKMLVPKGKYIEIQENGQFRNIKDQEAFENFRFENSKKYDNLGQQLQKQAGELFKQGKTSEGEELYTQMEQANDMANAYSDLKYAQTEYAMIQGYDGVHWDAPQDGQALKEEYIIFDRSSMIVQKPDYL